MNGHEEDNRWCAGRKGVPWHSSDNPGPIDLVASVNLVGTWHVLEYFLWELRLGHAAADFLQVEHHRMMTRAIYPVSQLYVA